MRIFVGVAFAVGAMLFFAVNAVAVPQPHMEAAVHALENALHDIELADKLNDHGGHAGEATNLIKQAIHEVKEGIRFRDEHK